MRRLAPTILAAMFLLVGSQATVANGLSAVTAEVSGGCVTHGEYDSLDWGLSTDQVANRFDTNGWLIAVGEDFFRRGYNACWTSDRVVVWYDLNLGLSDHWDVR